MRHDTPVNTIPLFLKQWEQCQRFKARHTDPHGFRVWGIILKIDVENDKVFIDSYDHCVKMSALIETIQI